MRAIWTVFVKEAKENLRDRRALFSAFLFVPLMGPVLFSVLTAFVVDRAVGEADEKLRMPVVGAANAPNLMRFFEENGAEIARIDGDLKMIRTLVGTGRESFVLIVPDKLGERLDRGEPTSLDLISDSSNNKAQRYVSLAHSLVQAYGRKIGALRLLARGIDPNIVSGIDVRVIDVATPSGRAIVLLGTLTYYLLFSLLLGGLYLAIDVTAGERERGSLESLLCLPLSREQLVLGKIAATVLFMLLALSLTLIALVISMRFLPLDRLGMASNLSPWVALEIAGIMIPMAVFGASLLFVVGCFTRSYREAQTWLGAVLAIPTLPILFAGIANVRTSSLLMLVPSLSQHLLATDLLRGNPLESANVVVSIASTVVAGGVLLWIATRLYRREALLG